MMAISYHDFVDSVSACIQFISFYHPADYIHALHIAYRTEQAPQAKEAIAQILLNSRMCAEGHRPICQDTGVVNVFLKVGMGACFTGFPGTLTDAVNDAVRRATLDPSNKLRASMVVDPLFDRRNTRDNSPAIVHAEMVTGSSVEVLVAAKGGGGENKAKFAVLLPSASVADWVVDMIPTMGAGWCPPGVIGLGVGGTPEKAMVMAKEVLLQPIDLPEIRERGAATELERLRLDICDRVNALAIGAQGLGGLTTVMDVKIATYPAHASSTPVALIPNCAATRRATFVLDGSGPVFLEPPSKAIWPDLEWNPEDGSRRRVDVDRLTRTEIAGWKAGDTLLLSGRILTGRDAAHKRIQEMLSAGKPLPVDFAGKLIYYVGPVDPVGDEAVGPAGPTTSTRMDKFTEMMLAETGLLGMIGKAERGPAAVDAIRRHGAAYLMATGGAAYLLSKSIRSARVLAFEDLGMEAIYEFEVVDMPVLVAVDARGENIHATGPAKWQSVMRSMRAD